MGFFSKMIVKINDFVNFEFIMNLMIAVQMDMLLGAFVGLKYGSFESFATIFNFMMSLILVLFYAFVTIFLSWKILLWNKEGDKLDSVHKSSKFKKWEFLLREIKTEVRLSTYIVALTVIKDFLYSPFIIFGIENANVQILPILGISIFMIIFVAKTKPFKSKTENFTLIANSLCYTVVLFMFLVLHNYTDNMS